MTQGNNYYPPTYGGATGTIPNPATYFDFYATGTDKDLLVREVDTDIRLAGYKNKWMQAIVTKTGKSRKIQNRKFEWLKDEVPNGEFTVAASCSGTTKNLAAGEGKKVLLNTLLYNPTRDDTVLVQSISTDALTVVQGVTLGIQSANTEWVEGDKVFSLGTSFGEKSTIPSGIVKSPLLDYNYTQRFLYGIEITKEMLRSKSYFQNPRAYWHKIEVEKHLLNEERLAIFGKRSTSDAGWAGTTDVTTANPANVGNHLFFGGCLSYISSHLIDLSGAVLTENLFRDQLDQIFSEGKDEKSMICSRAAAEHFARWMTDGSKNYRIQVTDNSIGYKCNTYEGGSGRINFLPTDVLKNVCTTPGAMTGDLLLILDFDQIQRVINEPTVVKMDAQNPESISVIKDYYDGQYGWDWGIEKCHAVIKNWTTA